MNRLHKNFIYLVAVLTVQGFFMLVQAQIMLDVYSGWNKPVGTWNPATRTGTLTQDVHESIFVYGNGITLDGNGHSVSFPAMYSYAAVRVAGYQVSATIKNLTIVNSFYGIMIDNVNGCTLFNNTIRGCRFGVLLWGSDNNTVYNNTFMNNLPWGAFLDDYGSSTSDNNLFYNNNFIGNPLQAGVQQGRNNRFYRDGPDGHGGNYWSNWCPPAHPDGNADGFVDVPYTDGYWKVDDRLPWAMKDGWLNKPPTCTVEPSGLLSVHAGATLTITVLATDSDAGDVITLTGRNLPAGATMDPALPSTGSSPLMSVFNWIPTATQRGTHSISFNATDRAGAAAGCSVDIEVLNNVPVTSGATPSVAEIWPPNNKMVSVAILGVTDPDDDPVTVKILSISDNEGSHADHACGVGTSTAQLCAQRDGKGNGRTYTILFSAEDSEGGVAQGSVTVAVSHDQGKVPTAFAVGNYPNPFNPSTTISYALPVPATVRLTIFNVLGQPVRALVNAAQRAGEYKVVWDGRDAHGAAVSSGMYFYRLEAGANVAVQRLLLAK